MSNDARVAGGILWIDVGAIVANWRALVARVQPAECAAVVKADAYGLGASRVVPALAQAGCRTYFVAGLDEGIEVAGLLAGENERRVSGIVGGPSSVYVLNGLIPGSEADFLQYGLQPVLNSLADIDRWAARARELNRPLAAALHVDTGMSRLGLPPTEVAQLAAAPSRLQPLKITLILSHLACADSPRHPLNARQLALFRQTVSNLPPAPASLANSGGVFLGAPFHGHLVRPGIALYGGAPSTDRIAANPMQPVVRLDGRILQVREIDVGATVGYGALHKSAHRARIATVAIGYADGFLRSLGNRGTGYVGDQAVPLVGRVSMDLTTFDVTAVPEPLARPGGFIELIGPHHPIDAVAGEAGTIAYEILTALGRRYHRVYTGSGC
ncbi:MAG: alanine racemase [Rhodospirillales bacterium]